MGHLLILKIWKDVSILDLKMETCFLLVLWDSNMVREWCPKCTFKDSSMKKSTVFDAKLWVINWS